jgi:gas vesicle protein
MPAMDTLHAYETLRSKFDEDTAKTIVGAVAGLVTPSFADLATKAELRTEIQDVKAVVEQLRLAMKAELDQAKTELRTEIQDVKADLRTTTAELRADMQGIKAELIRWLFGAALAIVSAMGIMLRLVR